MTSLTHDVKQTYASLCALSLSSVNSMRYLIHFCFSFRDCSACTDGTDENSSKDLDSLDKAKADLEFGSKQDPWSGIHEPRDLNRTARCGLNKFVQLRICLLTKRDNFVFNFLFSEWPGYKDANKFFN